MNDQQKKEQYFGVRDQEIRAALDQHWAASDANDFETEHRIYVEDAVLEYPQSGERTRGRRNIQNQRASQPSKKRFTVRRIIGGGDLWVTEFILTYDGKPSNAAGSTAPGFLISASPFSPNSVEAGAAARATVTLTPTNGFGGAVTLSCAALPAGANCSFAPASFASGSGTSTLTITTSASTPAGPYPIGLVGTSSSVTHSALVTLIVATPTGPTTVTLAPNSLMFAQQAAGTSSSPQTVQLTNTGSSPLTVSGISINGANAGDFTQTNSCTSPVANGAKCQITVGFKPTGMGSRTASLSISDNATGSPQMLSLTGTGPDFSLSAGSTSSATVMPGQTAPYTLSVAPSAGFNQTVALSCSGAPALTTCSISPSSLQLNSTTSSTAMVTITTTAPSMGRMLPLGRNNRFNNPRLQIFLIGLVSVALVGLLLLRKRSAQLRWATPFAFVALLLLAATLSSCGGGSSSGSSPGTAAGTYTITITGTAGTGSSATTHKATLTLVVQ